MTAGMEPGTAWSRGITRSGPLWNGECQLRVPGLWCLEDQVIYSPALPHPVSLSFCCTGGAPATSQHPDLCFCCHMTLSCSHWALTLTFTALGLLLVVEIYLGERSAVLASSIPSAGGAGNIATPAATPHLQSNLPPRCCPCHSLHSFSSSFSHSEGVSCSLSCP